MAGHAPLGRPRTWCSHVLGPWVTMGRMDRRVIALRSPSRQRGCSARRRSRDRPAGPIRSGSWRARPPTRRAASTNAASSRRSCGHRRAGARGGLAASRLDGRRRGRPTPRPSSAPRFVLALDDDHSEFLRRFAGDPLLGRATRELRGLRPIRARHGRAGAPARALRAADRVAPRPRARARGSCAPSRRRRRAGCGGADRSGPRLLSSAADLRRARPARPARRDARSAVPLARARAAAVTCRRRPWSPGSAASADSDRGRSRRRLPRGSRAARARARGRPRSRQAARRRCAVGGSRPGRRPSSLEPYGEWAGLASVYLLAAFGAGLVPGTQPRRLGVPARFRVAAASQPRLRRMAVDAVASRFSAQARSARRCIRGLRLLGLARRRPRSSASGRREERAPELARALRRARDALERRGRPRRRARRDRRQAAGHRRAARRDRRPARAPEQTVLSIAAAIPTARIEAHVAAGRAGRARDAEHAVDVVHEGIAGICAGAHAERRAPRAGGGGARAPRRRRARARAATWTRSPPSPARGRRTSRCWPRR